MYDTEISHTVLSQITSRRTRMAITSFRALILYSMAGRHLRCGKVCSKALYNILGINKEGNKEILGSYVSDSEGANFWLQVLIK